MDLTPEHRALLGVDVVGSARNPGYYLNALFETVDDILRTALLDSGIQPAAVIDWESTGDGALLTLPSRYLGCLVNLSQRIDALAAEHNLRHKPEARLRIAVEVGPVADGPGYYAAKISLTRLLNAPQFKKLLVRCLEDRPDGSVHTGLILSDHAFRCVFSGDYTESVQRNEFAEISVVDKEFSQSAWVRVPGCDSRSIAEFAGSLRSPDPQVAHERDARVHNEVRGNMAGVQAGTVNGSITFGGGRP